ncbi:hypothetical protein B0H10DRAFT_1979233 [Mycena sp. CBHHK59/15]|nr:hypothetical protein B0H10DRAFT_1979233 [Mycena sp. CBHHK59/15]
MQRNCGRAPLVGQRLALLPVLRICFVQLFSCLSALFIIIYYAPPSWLPLAHRFNLCAIACPMTTSACLSPLVGLRARGVCELGRGAFTGKRLELVQHRVYLS